MQERIKKSEWKDYLQSILDLLENNQAQNTFIRISTYDIAEILQRGTHHTARKALLELASRKMVVLDSENRIQRVMLVSYDKQTTERTKDMSQGKPIHSQPGGKGKLYGRGRDGWYEGTYYYSDNSKKPDRRRFDGNSLGQRDVVKKYDSWCKTLDDKQLAAMKAQIHPKKEVASVSVEEVQTSKLVQEKGQNMAAKGSAQVYQNVEKQEMPLSKIWVLVVQGKIINWFDNENSALNVASAMSIANKAAGITIEFDIQEVDKWSA